MPLTKYTFQGKHTCYMCCPADPSCPSLRGDHLPVQGESNVGPTLCSIWLLVCSYMLLSRAFHTMAKRRDACGVVILRLYKAHFNKESNKSLCELLCELGHWAV